MKIILTFFAILGLIYNILQFEHLHQTVESDFDFILILLSPVILFTIAFFTKESTYKGEFAFIEPVLMRVFVIGVVVIGFVLLFTYPFDTPETNTIAPIPKERQFYGYDCIGDCSGHEAGFEWAKNNDINYTSDCNGNSKSFVEGCQAWVENSPDPVWDMKE
jgi:hypothetical protein